MGMKQSIIDWLESVPGPTEAQARRWRRVRWGLVGLAVLAEILLWYVLYRMDVNDPPLWLAAPSDWLVALVPSVQGHANLSYNLREQMPYLFSISFVFAHAVALGSAFFNKNRLLIRVIMGFIRSPLFKLIIALPGLILLAWMGFNDLYLYASGVAESSDKTILGNIVESPLAIMVFWIPVYGFLGLLLGMFGSFVLDLFVICSRKTGFGCRD